MNSYEAFCAAHPEWQPDRRVEYADAVADVEQHQLDAHAMGVNTIADSEGANDAPPPADS